MIWRPWQVQQWLASQGFAPVPPRDCKRIAKRLNSGAKVRGLMRVPDYRTR